MRIAPIYKEALNKLIDYTEEQEYDNLLELLYSEHYDEDEEEPDFDAMSEEDLYLYCMDNKIDHIWTSVFQLKCMLTNK